MKCISSSSFAIVALFTPSLVRELKHNKKPVVFPFNRGCIRSRTPLTAGYLYERIKKEKAYLALT